MRVCPRSVYFEVIKVADFGVAKVQIDSGVMTTESRTYHWMAPEVIEHRTYGHEADAFSFGIVLWELLTGKVLHEHLTPLQAAVSSNRISYHMDYLSNLSAAISRVGTS